MKTVYLKTLQMKNSNQNNCQLARVLGSWCAFSTRTSHTAYHSWRELVARAIAYYCANITRTSIFTTQTILKLSFIILTLCIAPTALAQFTFQDTHEYEYDTTYNDYDDYDGGYILDVPVISSYPNFDLKPVYVELGGTGCPSLSVINTDSGSEIDLSIYKFDIHYEDYNHIIQSCTQLDDVRSYVSSLIATNNRDMLPIQLKVSIDISTVKDGYYVQTVSNYIYFKDAPASANTQRCTNVCPSVSIVENYSSTTEIVEIIAGNSAVINYEYITSKPCKTELFINDEYISESWGPTGNFVYTFTLGGVNSIKVVTKILDNSNCYCDVTKSLLVKESRQCDFSFFASYLPQWSYNHITQGPVIKKTVIDSMIFSFSSYSGTAVEIEKIDFFLIDSTHNIKTSLGTRDRADFIWRTKKDLSVTLPVLKPGIYVLFADMYIYDWNKGMGCNDSVTAKLIIQGDLKYHLNAPLSPSGGTTTINLSGVDGLDGGIMHRADWINIVEFTDDRLVFRYDAATQTRSAEIELFYPGTLKEYYTIPVTQEPAVYVISQNATQNNYCKTKTKDGTVITHPINPNQQLNQLLIMAEPGTTIKLDTGTYTINNPIRGRSLNIQSMSNILNDPYYIDNTIIKGHAIYYQSAVSFNNLTITEGRGTYGGAMLAVDSKLDFKNVVISQNTAEKGGAIYAKNADITMDYVTVVDNVTTYKNEENGNAIFLADTSSLVAMHSIVYNNRENYNYFMNGLISTDRTEYLKLYNTFIYSYRIPIYPYSDGEIKNKNLNPNCFSYYDIGNPRFYDPLHHDYHLMESSPLSAPCYGLNSLGAYYMPAKFDSLHFIPTQLIFPAVEYGDTIPKKLSVEIFNKSLFFVDLKDEYISDLPKGFEMTGAPLTLQSYQKKAIEIIFHPGAPKKKGSDTLKTALQFEAWNIKPSKLPIYYKYSSQSNIEIWPKSISENTIQSGYAVETSFDIVNTGESKSPEATLTYILIDEDAQQDLSDSANFNRFILGSAIIPQLSGGDTIQMPGNWFQIPQSFQTGNYKIVYHIQPKDTALENIAGNFNYHRIKVLRKPNLTIPEFEITGYGWDYTYVPDPHRTVTVQATVANIGLSVSGPTKVSYYMSKDDHFDMNEDYKLGEQILPALPEGDVVILDELTMAISKCNYFTTRPGVDPVPYIFARVDSANVVDEWIEHDNDNRAWVERAYDKDYSLWADPNWIVKQNLASGQFQIERIDIINGGCADMPATEVRYYLSTNTTDTMVCLASCQMPEDVNDWHDITTNCEFTVPDTCRTGDYYLLVCINPDRKIKETRYDNNLVHYNFNVTRLADLEITDISIDADTLETFETCNLTITVANTDEGTAAESMLEVYLATTENLHGSSPIKPYGDSYQFLGGIPVPELGYNEEFTISNYTITIPENISGNDYYIVCIADGREMIGKSIGTVQEMDEGNNMVAVPLRVNRISELFFYFESGIAENYPYIGIGALEGEIIDVMCHIRNIGETNLPYVEMRWYLSYDTYLDTLQDALMSIDTVSVDEFTTIQVEQSLQLPAVMPSGDYSVFVVIDPNNTITEFDETNNVLEIPLRISPLADLTIENASISPDVALPGSIFYMDFDFVNNGPGKTNEIAWAYVYISPEPNLNNSKIAEGRMLLPGFCAGCSQHYHIQYVDTLGANDWYLIFVANADSAVDEHTIENNVKIVPFTIGNAQLEVVPPLIQDSLSPASPLAFSCDIYNTGVVGADGSFEYYLVDSETDSSCILDDRFEPFTSEKISIEAGAVFHYTTNLTFPFRAFDYMQSGSQYILMKYDFNHDTIGPQYEHVPIYIKRYINIAMSPVYVHEAKTGKGDTIHVEFTIRDPRGFPAQPLNLRLFAKNINTGDSTLIYGCNDALLNWDGWEFNRAIGLPDDIDYGEYQLFVYVYEDQYSSLNNYHYCRYFDSFHIVPVPELHLSSAYTNIDNTMISGTVQNNGDGIAVSASIYFDLIKNDDPGTFITYPFGMYRLNEIAPGMSGNFDFNLDVPGNIKGQYYIRTTIDNVPLEQNTTNNIEYVPVFFPGYYDLDWVAGKETCPGCNDGYIKDVIFKNGVPPFTYQWSSGETTATLSDRPAGIYTLTMRDANGTAVTRDITIEQANALDIAATVNHVTTYGASDGEILLSVEGGTPPYYYYWQGGRSSRDLTGIPAGRYYVTVTDQLGQADFMQFVVRQPVHADFTVNNATLPGTANANIAAEFYGVEPYRFRWTKDGDPAFLKTTKDLANIGAGTYYFQAADMLDSTWFDTLVVTQPDTLKATFDVTDVSSYRAKDGVISVHPTGGIPPYNLVSYPLYRSGLTYSNMPAGIFEITIWDAYGQEYSEWVIVHQPIFLETTIYPITKHGAENGSIYACYFGGVSTLNIDWYKNDTLFASGPNRIYNLGPATYICKITDGSGAIKADTIHLTQPDTLNATFDVQQITSLGASDGQISIHATGGTAPYKFKIDGLSRTNEDFKYFGPDSSFQNLKPGYYSIHFRDVYNNFFDCGNAIINEPFTVTIGNIKNVTSYQAHDGEISDVKIHGGIYPKREWRKVEDTTFYSYYNLISNISGGHYILTVRDTLAQVWCDTIFVYEPEPLNITAAISHPTTYNGTEGHIEITPSGGYPPYTYEWYVESINNPEHNTKNPDQLGAGMVHYYITDSLNNTEYYYFRLFQPLSLFYNTGDVTAKDASDGYINYIYFNEGPNPRTIIVRDSSGNVLLNEYHDSFFSRKTNNDVLDIPGGTYTITIMDNRDTITETIEIHEPDEFRFEISKQDISSYGGSDGAYDISVYGGVPPYRYNWWLEQNGNYENRNTEDVFGLSKGWMSLNIYDANNNRLTYEDDICDPMIIASCKVIHASEFGETDGRVEFVNIRGGLWPYSYTWYNQSGDIIIRDTLEKFQNYVPELNNLAPGKYKIIVHDSDEPQRHIQREITIEEPNEFRVILHKNADVATAGGNDGELELELYGNPPFTVKWRCVPDIGASYIVNNHVKLSNLTAGRYIAEVWDSLSFYERIETFVYDPFDIRLTSIGHVSDYGENDGHIYISINGGDYPYSVQWKHNGVNFIPIGFDDRVLYDLYAGIYEVTVTDGLGQVAQRAFTVLQPAELIADIAPIHVSTYGGSNGSIQTQLSGNPPIQVQWMKDNQFFSNAATLYDLTAGSYRLNLTDSMGYRYSQTVNIYEPISIIAENVRHISEYGASDGNISVVLSGGHQTPQIQWANYRGQVISTSNSVSGLSQGNYFLRIIDNASGQILQRNYSITEPDPFVVSINDYAEPSYFGANDGFIEVNVSGGHRPYMYHWYYNNDIKPFSHSRNLQSLQPGTYRLVVNDGYYTSRELTKTLHEPLVVNGALVNHVSSPGADDGSIYFANAIGGQKPYHYSWYKGNANLDHYQRDISGLSGGEYILKVSDDYGRNTQDTFYVYEPGSLQVEKRITQISHYGASDGKIEIEVLQGTPPFQYIWTWKDYAGIYHSSNDTVLTNIPAGNYKLALSDSAGQYIHLTYTIFNPIDFQYTRIENVSLPDAHDGSIFITLNKKAIKYMWIRNGMNWKEGQSTSYFDYENISSGTYYLLVTDEIGRVSGKEFVVTEPVVLKSTYTYKHISEYGGSDGELQVIIQQANEPVSIRCTYGENGVLKEIFGTVFKNLKPNNYQIEVRDSSGQRKYHNIQLTEPLKMWESVEHVTTLYGNNGEIHLTVLGGKQPYKYRCYNKDEKLISTNNHIENLIAGIYKVVVTDSDGKTLSNTYEITQPEKLQVTINYTHPTAYLVNDGTLTANVSAGNPPYRVKSNFFEDFTVDDTTFSLHYDDLGPGWYRFSIDDDDNQSGDVTMNLYPPLEIQVDRLVHNTVYGINDGAISVSYTGGRDPVTYRWEKDGAFFSNNSHEISNLTAGEYRVIVTDRVNNSKELTLIVKAPPELDMDISVNHVYDENIKTGAMTAHIIGSPPYELKLFGPDKRNTTDTVIQGLSAGDYTLVLYDNSIQQIKTSFTITGPPVISYDVQQVSTPGGNDGSIYATISGGLAPFTYTWLKNGVPVASTKNINDLSKGVYEFFVTDSLQRTAQTTVFVTEEAYNLTVSADVQHCSNVSTNDGSIQLSVLNGQAPYTYIWSNGENTPDISSLAPGIYVCTIFDANQVSSSIVYSINNGLSVETFLSYPTNGQLNINAIASGTGPITYGWYTSGTLISSDSILYNVQPGNYLVTILDTALNTASKTVDIPYPGTLSFSANITNVSYGYPASGAIDLTVIGGYPPYTFDWSNNDTTEDIINLINGTYSVDIYDSIGNHVSGNFYVINNVEILSCDVTNVSMYGANDGQINIQFFYNINPVVRWWKDGGLINGENGLTLNNIAPGCYKAEATDAYGFVDYVTAVVTEPNQLVVDIEKNHISEPNGDDGSIIVHVQDGNPPYEVNFNNNGYVLNDTIHENLISGNYSIKVRDNIGQIYADNHVFLSDSFRLQIDYANCPVKGCNDRTINIIQHGGNISASQLRENILCVKDGTDTILSAPQGSAYTFSNMAAGAYGFYIMDNDGREVFDTIEITEPNNLSYWYEVTHASCKDCNDGSVKFHIDESNGPVRIKGPNGTYTTTDSLFVYNNIGVEYEYGFTIYDNLYSQAEYITVGSPLEIGYYLYFRPEINSYETYISVTGGVFPIHIESLVNGVIVNQETYHYYHNYEMRQDVLSEIPDQYSLYVVDGDGNKDSMIYSFNNLPPVTVDVTTTNPSTYGGLDGRIDVNVLSGVPPYRVMRSNTNEIPVLVNLRALKTYNVSVYDYYGQVLTFDTMLYHQVYFQPQITNISGRNESDGEIILYSRGGSFNFDLPNSYQYISMRENHYTYEWKKDGIIIPGGESIENLTRGTYTVLVTDPVGITKRDTFRISHPNYIPLITAQLPHTANEDEFIPISLDNLIVTDTDDTYPNDFTLNIVPDPDMLILNDTIYPPNEFSGTLQVQLYVNDQWDNSNAFTYEITVLPVNDPPQVLSHKYITVVEDSSFTFSLNDIVFNDVDADSTTVFELLVNQGQNYSAADYTIQPKSNYFGDLHIPVQVSDGQDTSGIFSVFVDVLPVNDVPQILHVDTVVTENDVPVQLSVDMIEVFDPDDGPSSMSYIIYPGLNYSYNGDVIAPEQHFVGDLNVNCRICDGKDTSELFVVPVRVDFALPDFVISGLEVQSTANITDEIPLAFYMKNTGKPVPPGTLLDYKVYMSEGIDTTGAMYKTGSVLSAQAGDSVFVSSLFTLNPSSNTGDYTFTLIVDQENVFPEYEEGNNIEQTSIQILPFDLAVIDFVLPVTEIMPFMAFGFSATISNAGTGHAPASQLALYISEDALYDPGDEQIAVFEIAQIEAGASFIVNENFTLLSSPDTSMKYIICVIDEQNYLSEANETNNTLAGNITIKLPDLVIRQTNQVPAVIHLGEGFTIEMILKNTGGTITDTETFEVKSCLSAQSTDCIAALDVNDLTYSGLLSGDSVTELLSFYVPEDTPPGNYFINIRIDTYSTIDESDESNNTVSIPVTLNPPDLSISGFQCGVGIIRGAENQFEYMISNIGVGNCPVSTVGLYYSTDNILDTFDEPIAQFTVDPIAAGTSMIDTVSVFIDSYPDPAYAFILCNLDDGYNFPEPDESDNYFALPVDLSWPDIAIAGADIDDIIALSEVFAFELSIINNNGQCNPDENSFVSVFFTEHNNSANYFEHQIFLLDPLNTGQQETMYPELFVDDVPPGIYDIVIQVDATDNIQESDETNNTYVHQVEIEAGDLKVLDIDIPNPVVYNGLEIDIEILVENNGDGNIQNTEYTVFLSQDDIPLNGNDIFLTQIDYDDVMFSGDIMQLTTTCEIEPAVDTSYKYIIAIADEPNSIVESDETNNNLIVPFGFRMPDLKISVAQLTDSIWPDEEFECTVIVKNIGTGNSDSGVILNFGIYSDPDGAGYVEGGGNVEMPYLAPGDSIVIPYFTGLNPFYPAGTYYFSVMANEDQFMREWSYENNEKAQAFNLRHVNREFTISNFEVNPAPVFSGDNISWQFDLAYSGERMVYSPDVSLYLSEDDVFDISEDQQIDYIVMGNMEDGDILSASSNYPSYGLSTGQYHLFAVVDEANIYIEINEDDNVFECSFLLTLDGNYPDLALMNFQAPDTIIQASSYNFSYDIQNIGTVSVDEYNVFYYLSNDSVLSGDDTYLGSSNNEVEEWDENTGTWEYYYDELDPNEVHNKDFRKSFPANQPPGQWYVIIIADYYNSTTELLEDNNILIQPLQINRRGPDLVIEDLQVNYQARLQGNSQSWSCDVHNIGNDCADTCEIVFYISQDTIKSMDDIWAGEQSNELEENGVYYYNTLYPNDSLPFNKSVHLPANIEPGQWYLLAIVDFGNNTHELKEGNNMAWVPFEVIRRGPDLVIQNFQLQYSSRLQGNFQSWSCDIHNIGNYYADTCEIVFYFSQDTIKSMDDIWVGEQSNEIEEDGEYYYNTLNADDSLTFYGNDHLPANIEPGIWYVLAIVDYGNNTHELEEGNNMAWVPFEVIRRGPDLVIQNLSIYYSTLLQGSTQYWSCNIMNMGNADADTCEVVYYFSRDTIQSPDDIWAGYTDNWVEEYDEYYDEYYYHYDDIYAGNSYNFNASMWIDNNFEPGLWYLLAVADRYENLMELEENNNISWSTFTVGDASKTKQKVYAGNFTPTEIKVFPNPVDEKLSILLPEENRDENNDFYSVTIFDNLGKQVEKIHIEQNVPLVEINMSQFAIGIYYLSISNRKDIVIKKVIKMGK